MEATDGSIDRVQCSGARREVHKQLSSDSGVLDDYEADTMSDIEDDIELEFDRSVVKWRPWIV